MGTEYPGYNTSTVFLRQNDQGDWSNYVQATRSFDGLSYKADGHLAGMGPGILKINRDGTEFGTISHPRPFEHSFYAGGLSIVLVRMVTTGAFYQPIAPFSAEGYCKIEIDNQNRLNVLVLGDHTDTQLYLLRYQLPGDDLMECFPRSTLLL